MIRKIATSLARDRVKLILSDLISEKSTRRLHKKRLLNDHSFDQPLSMITSLNRWLLARFLSFTPRGVFFFSSLVRFLLVLKRNNNYGVSQTP